MRGKKRKQCIRYFLAVEGPSEQSFVKWIQQCLDQKGLNVHLECQPLGGGGYESMLNNAVRYFKRNRHIAKSSILLVDADRAKDDHWSHDQLRKAVTEKKFKVIFRHPNLEGVLLRMLPNKERLQPNTAHTYSQLCQAWPVYQKPADARTLASKFSLDDLYRAARVDPELNMLLSIVGLSMADC